MCVCMTWATEMNMLVFVISAASQTPGVIGQGEQVLQPGRVCYGPVQTLDPLLALLERCKVASVEIRKIRDPTAKYLVTTSCIWGVEEQQQQQQKKS